MCNMLIKFRPGIEPAPTFGKPPVRSVRFQKPTDGKNNNIPKPPREVVPPKSATSKGRREYADKKQATARVSIKTAPAPSARSKRSSRKRDERDSSDEDESERDTKSKRSRKTSLHEAAGKFEAEEGERKSRSAPGEFQEVIVDGKKLRLKRFKPEWMMKIAKNPSVVMVAKRGSGKSVALRHIMRVYNMIPGGNVISLSERLNDFFKDFFPELFIFEKFDEGILENLLERQDRIKEKNKRRVKAGKRPIDTRAWLIMDDCLAHAGSWKKSETVAEIFYNGRHFDLFYILTMQYPLGIGPDLRINFDFVFLFGENYSNIRRKIFEHYAGMFPNYNAFEKVFAKVTKNFGCMVINNREKSDVISDVVYWWRAEDAEIKEYLGAKSFTSCHKKWFNKDYAKKDRAEKGKFSNDLMRTNKSKALNFDIELEDEDLET